MGFWGVQKYSTWPNHHVDPGSQDTKAIALFHQFFILFLAAQQVVEVTKRQKRKITV